MSVSDEGKDNEGWMIVYDENQVEIFSSKFTMNLSIMSHGEWHHESRNNYNCSGRNTSRVKLAMEFVFLWRCSQIFVEGVGVEEARLDFNVVEIAEYVGSITSHLDICCY